MPGTAGISSAMGSMASGSSNSTKSSKQPIDSGKYFEGNFTITAGAADSVFIYAPNNNIMIGARISGGIFKSKYSGNTKAKLWTYSGNTYIMGSDLLPNKSDYSLKHSNKTTYSPSKYWIRTDSKSLHLGKNNWKKADSKASSGTAIENSTGTAATNATGTVTDAASVMDFSNGARNTSKDLKSNGNDVMEDALFRSSKGIFGLPYQWSTGTDTRYGGSKFGRLYTEKIASRAPLLLLTPGSPSFMPGASDEDKKNMLDYIVSSIAGAGDTIKGLAKTFLGSASDEGCDRYYTFNFDFDGYYTYVNPMCQTMAKILKLKERYGNVVINKNPVNLYTYHWKNALAADFKKYFSCAESIPFYIDSANSVSESFGNETTASMLASAVKQGSSAAKELNFIMGTGAAISDENSLIQGVTEALDGIKDKVAGTSAEGFLGNVSKAVGAVAKGGAMLFPDIWDSSSFGRSYNVNMKLRSPDCDDLSIYLNVLVPYLHLVGFVAPRTIQNNFNTYSSPPLVRAHCRSMFNIDMGIITSMDVSKGKEGSWNANGLPTEMDISLTIKDLYEVFALSQIEPSINIFKDAKNASKFVRNTAEMDWLCNTAGLNINKNELLRNLDTILNLTTNSVLNWPDHQWLRFQRYIDNKVASIFNKSKILR